MVSLLWNLSCDTNEPIYRTDTDTQAWRTDSQLSRGTGHAGGWIGSLGLLSHFSRVRLCATPEMAAHQVPRPWDSPGKNTRVGCHFLLQCMTVKSEVKLLSHVRLLATPWTAAHQAPPSLGFSRQEYWSGMPLPSLGSLGLADANYYTWNG